MKDCPKCGEDGYCKECATKNVVLRELANRWERDASRNPANDDRDATLRECATELCEELNK